MDPPNLTNATEALHLSSATMPIKSFEEILQFERNQKAQSYPFRTAQYLSSVAQYSDVQVPVSMECETPLCRPVPATRLPYSWIDPTAQQNFSSVFLDQLRLVPPRLSFQTKGNGQPIADQRFTEALQYVEAKNQSASRSQVLETRYALDQFFKVLNVPQKIPVQGTTSSEGMSPETPKRVFKRIKYSCSACSVELKSVAQFKEHMLEVHGNIRAFKCRLCPNQYTSRSIMLRHMKSHSK
ncbi:hypothetical protein L596_001268 [Steinernema carpocapsae]|uniref:C2H2-type domain-containing protein n=1 Tax=Steinernema carpocapsae TaxID=34508 RepID=A0A4U8UN89_STECR|nr:hypothetical protein L596_001268 [Steinernema carpocapsae]